MTHESDNPYPVDPTGPLTLGSIPEDDLDRLIEATIPNGHQTLGWLRSALAVVDPAMLTSSDIGALLDLIQAALDSDSEWANSVRSGEKARANGDANEGPAVDTSRDW